MTHDPMLYLLQSLVGFQFGVSMMLMVRTEPHHRVRAGSILTTLSLGVFTLVVLGLQPYDTTRRVFLSVVMAYSIFVGLKMHAYVSMARNSGVGRVEPLLTKQKERCRSRGRHRHPDSEF